MLTLSDVKAQWDPVLSAEFRMTLEFAETNETQGYIALEDIDAEIVNQRIEVIIEVLRQYPPTFLNKTKLSVLRMIKGNIGFYGRAGGKYLIINAVPLSALPGVVHHELMHVLDQTDPRWGGAGDPHPKWKNPPDFVYGQPWPDRIGFVTSYAQKAYREDLADTAKWIWTKQNLLLPKIETDELLRNKCRLIIEWWSGEGLTQFNDLFGISTSRTVMTDRIAGASRFETAVQVSRVRFPNGGVSTIYLANSHNFPDALVGGTLATDGPLLLVPTTGAVPDAVLNEARRLQPDRIIAIGGLTSVSEETLQAVRNAAQGG